MNAALAPESLGRAELVFALGAGLILVSGLLPWIAASEAIPVADPSEEADGLASFDGNSTSEDILGIDRVDWVVLAGVGLVATFLVVTEPWSRVVLAVAGASGVAAVGLGAVYLVDPAWMYSDWIKSDVAAVASAGPGAYLAIGGGILQCGGCYLGYSGPAATGGAQQLDAPAQPGTNRPTRAEQPSQGQPHRGGQPSQQDPHSRQGPPSGRRPPQGGEPRQGRPPQTGPGEQPPQNRPEREYRQQPGHEQPPTGQPPSNQRPGADGPADESISEPSAGDKREGTGTGQQSHNHPDRDAGEVSTEDDGSDDDTEQGRT